MPLARGAPSQKYCDQTKVSVLLSVQKLSDLHESVGRQEQGGCGKTSLEKLSRDETSLAAAV